MAWTTPAMPHQSECFAHRGWIHSSPTICHMLIWNWKVVLRAFAIRGPWAATGTCLHKVSLIFLRKASMALSAWACATRHVASSRCMTGSSGLPLLITCFCASASLAWAASCFSQAFITVATYSLIAPLNVRGKWWGRHSPYGLQWSVLPPARRPLQWPLGWHSGHQYGKRPVGPSRFW